MRENGRGEHPLLFCAAMNRVLGVSRWKQLSRPGDRRRLPRLLPLTEPGVGITCIAEAGIRTAAELEDTFTIDIDAVAGAIPGSCASPAVCVALVEDFSAESPTGWVLGVARSLHVYTTQIGGRRSHRRCSETCAQRAGQRGDRSDLLHVFPPRGNMIDSAFQTCLKT